MVSVLAHINEVMMVVKLMTPILTWPFALKSFFLLQMHLCIIEEFEVFVKFGKFFNVLYFKLLSNFYQAFIGFE